MHDAWYNLFTITRMMLFLAGFASAMGWYRLRNKEAVLDWTPLGIIGGVAVIVFIAIQQVGLAAEVKQCQGQFNTVLQERANLSDRSDTWTGEEIDANSKWLAALTNPPPDIAALHTTDPIYREWVRGTLRDYLVTLNGIREERAHALDERKKRTYPEPTCGK